MHESIFKRNEQSGNTLPTSSLAESITKVPNRRAYNSSIRSLPFIKSDLKSEDTQMESGRSRHNTLTEMRL